MTYNIADDLISEADRTDADAPRCSKLLRDAAERIRELETAGRILQDRLESRPAAVIDQQKMIDALTAELNEYHRDWGELCDIAGIPDDSEAPVLKCALLTWKDRCHGSQNDLNKVRRELQTPTGQSTDARAETVMTMLERYKDEAHVATAKLTQILNLVTSPDCYKDEPLGAKRIELAIDVINDRTCRMRTMDAALSAFQKAAGGADDCRGLFAYGLDQWTRQVIKDLRKGALGVDKKLFFEALSAIYSVIDLQQSGDVPSDLLGVASKLREIRDRMHETADLAADRLHTIRRIATLLDYELPKAGYVDEILERIARLKVDAVKVEAMRRVVL